jgi:hypothetical protein
MPGLLIRRDMKRAPTGYPVGALKYEPGFGYCAGKKDSRASFGI